MTSRVFPFATLALLLLLASGCGDGKKTVKKPSGNIAKEKKAAQDEPDPEQRARKFAKVAVMEKDAADLSGAQSSLTSAIDAADQIEDPKGKANVLNSIAETQAKLDLMPEAKNSLKKVQAALEKIEEKEAKIPIICRMAAVYSQAGNKDAATGHLKGCEDVANGIEAIELRIAYLLDVAVVYSKIDAAAEAKRIIDQSFELARESEDKRKRADALSEIGGKLGAMKKSDEAKAAFEEAEKAIAEIETDDGRGYATVTLAEKQIAGGFKGAASDTLKKAAALSGKITDTSLSGSLNEKIEHLRSKLK